jgi:hypothetical protein
MIRRTRYSEWGEGTSNKADVRQHSRLYFRFETWATIGLPIMDDDVLARDLVPEVEPFARMHIPRRQEQLHAIPSSDSRAAEQKCQRSRFHSFTG